MPQREANRNMLLAQHVAGCRDQRPKVDLHPSVDADQSEGNRIRIEEHTGAACGRHDPPQFGSRPWTAVFTRDDPQTVRATRNAAASSSFPCTSIRRVAPSPSRAMAWASCCIAWVRPCSRTAWCSLYGAGPAQRARCRWCWCLHPP